MVLHTDASLESASASEVDFEPVKRLLRSAVADGEATGVAVAVVHRGQIVWEEGFGFADSERHIASGPNTSYSLASITKAFTTTLVTVLAEQKAISLDGPAKPYLKASPLKNANGDADLVTIRMLGAHSSGLPGTFAAHVTNGPAPVQTTADFLRDYGRLAYPAGEVYEYGNIGFEALGAIIQNLTGEDVGTVMDERILQPLELHDTFYSNSVDRLSSAAIGYDDDAKPIPSYSTSTPPSGELYASAHDLARFALFNLRSAEIKSILSDEGIRELQKPVFTGPHGLSSTFGWFTGNLDTGEPYLFKGGGQPGVSAKLFLLPSVDLGCVVLTNRTDNMPLVEECCKLIIRNYVPNFTVPEEDAGPRSSTFRTTPETIGVWRGKLFNGGAEQLVRFEMAADGTTTLGLSDRPSESVTDIQGQKQGFEGTTTGIIDCEHAAAFGERTLMIKLVPQQGRLIGRITARGTRQGLLLANIPYVLTLEPVKAESTFIQRATRAAIAGLSTDSPDVRLSR